MTLGEVENRIHFGGMAGVVDGKNRAREGSDAARDFFRIEIQRVGSDVSENRSRSLVEDAVRGGSESHGRSDGFVAGLEVRGEGSGMQGGGSGTEAHRMLRADAGCEGFFELLDLGACGQPIGTENIDDGLNVVFVNGLAAIGQQGLADGSSAVDGERFVAGELS